MLSFVDIDKDNVVGFHIDGKINDTSFEAALALLEKKLREHSNVRIYAEMESFAGYSPKAFYRDLKFALNNWDRFDKEAIVTEKDWIEKVVEWEDELFSEIELKGFSFEEKEQAKEWIKN